MLPIKSCVMRIDRVFDVLPCMQTLLIEGLSGGGGKCYKEQYEKFPVPRGDLRLRLEWNFSMG